MNIRQLLFACVIALLVIPAVSSQENDDDSVNLHVMTVYVQEIAPHPQGYRVIYTRSDLYAGVVYLPSRWFTVAGGKGEILYTIGRSAPYMEVYYVDGEFSHVRLYAQRNRMHPSWGNLSGAEDLSDEFAAETLQINY
jgi:hypothetical protein